MSDSATIQNPAEPMAASNAVADSKVSSASVGRAAKSIAILVNIVAPYRVPVYKALAERFRAVVFVSGAEKNRGAWGATGKGLDVRKAMGFTLALKKKVDGKVFDTKFAHFNPGFLLDLIRTGPAAVLANEMGFPSLCALLYGTLFRRPVWIWWGGTLHTERHVGRVKKLLRAVIVRWSRHWISYGTTSTEYLLSIGVRKERIVQIQNCVDAALFNPTIAPAMQFSPAPVLLHVGQFIERKGVGHLLESAARLQQRGLEFTLVLIGDGPDKAALQTRAANLGLKNVQFLPPQKPDALPAYYRSADCLIFPTLEDVWGLVVNEALLCGVPVLSSVYGGCTAEIVPEQNRFDPLNAQDFDRALTLAVERKLAPADSSALKTAQQVADLIIGDIERVLAK